MPKLEIEISEEALAKLQRLAEKEGKPIAELAAQEFEIAMERHPRYLDCTAWELMASMVHEHRQSLNAIIGFSRVILRGIDGQISDALREDMVTIYQSGIRVRKGLIEILDLAKIEYGKLVEGFSEVDLLDFLQAHVHGNGLHFTMLSSLPMIMADQFRLGQVLTGIITFFAVPQEVALSVYATNAEVIFQLEGGLPKNDLYDPIAAYLESHEWIINRYIIAAHKGTLTVDDSRLPQLTFTITLPINREVSDAEAGN